MPIYGVAILFLDGLALVGLHLNGKRCVCVCVCVCVCCVCVCVLCVCVSVCLCVSRSVAH